MLDSRRKICINISDNGRFTKGPRTEEFIITGFTVRITSPLVSFKPILNSPFFVVPVVRFPDTGG
jgi:hypothetical protein